MNSFIIIRRSSDQLEQVMAQWCRSIEKLISTRKAALIIFDEPAIDRSTILKALTEMKDAHLLYYGHGSKGEIIDKNLNILISAETDALLLKNRFCYMVSCYGESMTTNKINGCLIGYKENLDVYCFLEKKKDIVTYTAFKGFEESANEALSFLISGSGNAGEAIQKGKQIYHYWKNRYLTKTVLNMSNDELTKDERLMAPHIASILFKNARALCCKGNINFRL